MPLPSKRDHAELRLRLHVWLAGRLPDATAIQISELQIPEGTGMSSETLLFTASWMAASGPVTRNLVARMEPDMSDYPVFPAYDLALQSRCLQVVGARTDVPVPEVLWFEPSAEPLGAPFLVMGRVDGAAPPDVPVPYVFAGPIVDASAAGQESWERASVAVLVKLHELAGDDPDLAFLDRPEFGASALDQHLGYQRWYYDWARGDLRSPIIEEAFQWLDAHRPAAVETVLNWGDSRVGNILYRELHPVAVLDWEMAALGPRQIDAGWMCLMHLFFTDLAERAGFPSPLAHLLTPERVVALYREMSGVDLGDLHWYEVFAATRFAIVSLRTSGRAIHYGEMEDPGDDVDGLVMHAHLLRALLAR